MADILIRNVDPRLRDSLKQRARLRGRSMSDEARDILGQALVSTIDGPPEKLGTWMVELFREAGPVDLAIDRSDAGRDPPTFD